MTIANKMPAAQGTETGAIVPLDLDFRFLAGTIVADRVLVDGSVVALTEGVDFTVTGGTTDAGGTLVPLAAAAAGTVLRARRVTPSTQQTDYIETDAFPAESHEGALDRAMMIVQEINRDQLALAARTILMPDGELAATLPAPAARANTIWAFDGSGDLLLRSSASFVAEVAALVPTGPKGDPGGNVLAVGLASQIGDTAIGAGTDLIATVGYDTIGKGAATYVADALADEALLAAHPLAVKQDQAGRIFRLLPVNGAIHVEQLGAVGDGAADAQPAIQAACDYAAVVGISTVLVGKGTYRLNNGLDVPSNVSLVGTGKSSTTFNFFGVDYAVAFGGAGHLYGFSLISQSAGQSGVMIKGGTGHTIGDLILKDFDGTSFMLGNSGVSGVYFADVDYVEVNNPTRTGAVGIAVHGLVIPNSNANILRNCFVKGRVTKHYHIKGNANIIIGGDSEPNNSAAPVSECYHIEGIGNRILTPYIEPVGATVPSVMFRFGSASYGNVIERIYAPSGGDKIFSRIVDEGTANEVDIRPNGENFAPSVGLARSSVNLLPNADFRNIDSTDSMPVGWSKSLTGSSTAARDNTQTRGATNSLKLACTGDGRAFVDTFLATNNPGARLPLVTFPIAKLRGKTITAGVWCYSTTASFGAIKFNNGPSTVGVAAHSGSGSWEFLTVQTKIAADATEISLQLRSNKNNANSAGECWFTEPVVVFGSEIPQVPEPKPLVDGEAVMAGRFVGSPWQTFANGDTTPSVLEGNFFKTANTAATSISNFDDRPVGKGAQIIYVKVEDANTTLLQTGTLQTTTGANKPLTNGQIYKLIWDAPAGKWIEF